MLAVTALRSNSDKTELTGLFSRLPRSHPTNHPANETKSAQQERDCRQVHSHPAQQLLESESSVEVQACGSLLPSDLGQCPPTKPTSEQTMSSNPNLAQVLFTDFHSTDKIQGSVGDSDSTPPTLLFRINQSRVHGRTAQARNIGPSGAEHSLAHTDENEVVCRIGPEPGVSRPLPVKRAFADYVIGLRRIIKHGQIVSPSVSGAYHGSGDRKFPVISRGGRWFEVIRSTEDGERSRTPSSEPRFRSICANRE